jgi:3-isopropylmalate/(R)-2-methylmalate dehydratase small subunit
MEPLITHEGTAVYLNRVNVDTDQIIPKQFLKRIERSGFGDYLFYDWRFLADGTEVTTFELNQPHTHGASILVAEHNFGCGSSREHAVWALRDYGFRVIIAPSYADIFYNNCFKNGVLPITLSEDKFSHVRASQSGGTMSMTVNLAENFIELAHGMRLTFDLEPHLQKRLLEGLDDIGLTMIYNPQIDEYEKKRNVYQFAHTI